ncbi:uncharacterized protein BJ171DRAFT_601427 [Polychytrium aggregatum]|uniref:uncharacterized protein n=1 Tax=Polychytrium aggregatum TaxID=110093 RepID=UPI0022FF3FEA|nr:uncharacterized protein BJ171DRAFT_601427 [Polychytrium aggregatum]KAI9201855.1 hypothetical protein BJ171DRAFT_601427 [Polychytrium aggregatum]
MDGDPDTAPTESLDEPPVESEAIPDEREADPSGENPATTMDREEPTTASDNNGPMETYESQSAGDGIIINQISVVEEEGEEAEVLENAGSDPLDTIAPRPTESPTLMADFAPAPPTTPRPGANAEMLDASGASQTEQPIAESSVVTDASAGDGATYTVPVDLHPAQGPDAQSQANEATKPNDPPGDHPDVGSVALGPNDIKSNLNLWYRKKYMGGYRNTATGTEYFHGTTQTTTPQEKRAALNILKFHRDTQTKFIHHRFSQCRVDSFTQMERPGVFISSESDYFCRPRRYVTAEEHHKMIVKNVIRIQCFVRRCYAMRLIKRLRKEHHERMEAMAAREERRRLLIERKRQKEMESRIHPKSNKDFEVLYNGLESKLRKLEKESSKINRSGYSDPARLAALAELLDQEAALIQKIDRLKIAASEENRERAVIRLLDQMASPKRWPAAKNTVCLVDTPNTLRARELRDLFHALNIPLLSVDERLQILLHVKYTVKEFDCNLTREIVDLIDREGDLVSRGRDARSLEGLRKRIGNLFLQFIQTPEFNPEALAHQQYPESNQAWKRDQSVYYCRGCTRYLPSTAFYLSTTMKHLGKCKACTLNSNIATTRNDDSTYTEMLKYAKTRELEKRRITGMPEDAHYNAMSLLQESDLRYLVDTIWNKQSAVSGSKNMDDLCITRWNPRIELSPWNCILLTKTEASNHETQNNPEDLYSEEFVRKVSGKHMAAKKHFSQLPSMERYMKKMYIPSAETSQTLASQGLAPKPRTSQTIASQSLASQALAAPTIASQTLVSQTLTPQRSAELQV